MLPTTYYDIQDEKKNDNGKKEKEDFKAKEPSSVLPAMQRLLVGKYIEATSTYATAVPSCYIVFTSPFLTLLHFTLLPTNPHLFTLHLSTQLHFSPPHSTHPHSTVIHSSPLHSPPLYSY